MMSVLKKDIAKIKYSSIKEVGTQIRSLDIKRTEISKVMSYAVELSDTKAYRLARGILSTTGEIESFKEETSSLISWAKTSGVKERKMIAKVIRKEKGDEGDIYLVHSISAMNKKDARAFMADYLNSGGSIKAITEWLAMAGEVLREHQEGEPRVVSKGIGSWLKKTVKSVGGALADGISSVVDAVVSAGKSLVEMVGDVMSNVAEWTIEKVGDLVSTLIDAGKSIGEILQAALEKGLSAMKKFVEAIFSIGKGIGDVLLAVYETMTNAVSSVLKTLLAIGKSIAEIVSSAIEVIGEKLNSLLQTLIEIGQSIGRILKSIVEAAADLLESVLKSLIEIGQSIGSIISSIYTVASNLVKSVIKGLIDIGKDIASIIRSTVNLAIGIFTKVVDAFIKLGRRVSELLNDAMNAVYNGLKRTAEALIRLGKKVIELISWAMHRTAEMLKDILLGMVEAGKAIVDILADVAAKSINVIHKVIDGLISIGKKVVDLLEDALTLGIRFVRKFITSVTQIVGGLVRFSTEVLRFSYRTTASLVKKMLNAGVTVIEVLGMVVGAGYFVFRRMINGILQNTGKVGEVLDWVLTQAEDTVSELWHDALLSIRYAKAKLTDAIDWAVSKGDEAMEELLKAWESVEENLIEFYSYAAKIARNGTKKVFEYIGKATVKLENSIGYVLTYLEKDYIVGIRDFIKGVLDAGYALSELFVNVVSMTLEAFTEVIKTTLDYGVTLGALIVETMKNPQNIVENFMKAVEEAGKSIQDVYQAVIVDLSEEFIEEVTNTYYKMKKAVKDILHAVAEIYLGALATVISILLNTLGSYRPMRADEIVEAKKIYGNTLDYSSIYFSQESLSNDILFGIQDFITKNEDSRAFVSNTLVNFDVNDGEIEYDTMIHELCHVWQYKDTGAFYMSEAIHAQYFGEGYNYGYTNTANGDGGEDDLLNAISSHPNLTIRDVFELFNREQQAQIVMHYYVRKYKSNPVSNCTAWEPFQALVYA